MDGDSLIKAEKDENYSKIYFCIFLSLQKQQDGIRFS